MSHSMSSSTKIILWLLAAPTIIFFSKQAFVETEAEDVHTVGTRIGMDERSDQQKYDTILHDIRAEVNGSKNHTTLRVSGGLSDNTTSSAIRQRRVEKDYDDDDKDSEDGNGSNKKKEKKDCPQIPKGATVDFYISPKKMKTIYEAAKLNIWSSNFIVGDITKQQEALEQRYERFQGFTNKIDAAIVAKSQGVCHVVFGTGILPADLIQNLDPRNEKMENTDCRVRKSLKDIYFNRYYEDLKKETKQCLRSCRHQGAGDFCPLAVSGYSQGGGVAYIAAIDLRKYNPTTITFGATQGIIYPGKGNNPCTDFDAENHYRFVTTRLRFYDQIAVQPSPYGARHAGQLLHLDPDEKYLGYPGLNAPETRLPFFFLPHLPNMYIYRIQQLMDTNCRIAAVKWQPGHWCGYDDECASGICAKKLALGECA